MYYHKYRYELKSCYSAVYTLQYLASQEPYCSELDDSSY